MFKVSGILLSLALVLSTAGSARAQYADALRGQPFADPRLNTPDPALRNRAEMRDPLDAIYDEINAQAAQKPQVLQKPVLDPRAYNQFMNQTMDNLSVEHANTANSAEARRRDAVITGAYEQKKIDDMANWEKAQLQQSAGPILRRGRYGYYPVGNPGTTNSPQMNNIEANRQMGLMRSQDVVDDRLQTNQMQAANRDQTMDDVANNLRDQVLSTQSSPNKGFGLQGVGTNLYVRQYGRPDANLPPVHNAAARIVPQGGADD